MESSAGNTPPGIPSAAVPPSKNFGQRVAGVLFAPAETFEDIARRPDVLMPLILILLISFLSTAIVMPRMDFEAMAAEQGETMRKHNPNMTSADIERMERFTVAIAKVTGWISPLFVLLWWVIIAAVLLLAMRLMGGEGSFKQAFSGTLYSWIPLVLFGIITSIVVLARGSFDPTTASTLVKSNPAFLVDMQEQPVLFSLLASFDVFTIWTIALLILAVAAISKLSRAKSAAIVISLWLVMIVIKLGFAALGAARMQA
jgi:hypothetical protein